MQQCLKNMTRRNRYRFRLAPLCGITYDAMCRVLSYVIYVSFVEIGVFPNVQTVGWPDFLSYFY